MVVVNGIYKAKTGTVHYVRIVDKRREFFKNEPMDNTAPIFQYGLQRQKIENSKFVDDLNYEVFSMYEDNVLDCYELVFFDKDSICTTIM